MSATHSGWASALGPSGIPHVYPTWDFEVHNLDDQLVDGTLDLHCWCRPCCVGNTIVHHAADHREDDEPGRHVCMLRPGEA